MIPKPPPLQGVDSWMSLALGLLFIACMAAVMVLAVTR